MVDRAVFVVVVVFAPLSPSTNARSLDDNDGEEGDVFRGCDGDGALLLRSNGNDNDNATTFRGRIDLDADGA